MPWYQYEPEKKYPFVPAESSGEGDVRWPLTVIGLVVGVIALLVGAVASIVGAGQLAWIALGVAAVCWLGVHFSVSR